jgi:hypothetical protein
MNNRRWLAEESAEELLWHGGNSMVRTSRANSVCLVDLVCLVYLVHLVSFVQPNKRDRPNKPNNGLRTLADFFSIRLGRLPHVPREMPSVFIVPLSI